MGEVPLSGWKNMSQNVTIRTARIEDSTRIAELVGELGYSIEADLIRQRIAAWARHDTDRIWVGVWEEKVAGVLSFHLIPLLQASGYLGRITALVVHRDFQGKGIGRKLVEKAEEWAWAHDCARTELTSGDQRLNAHRFYQNIGYEVQSKRFVKRKP